MKKWTIKSISTLCLAIECCYQKGYRHSTHDIAVRCCVKPYCSGSEFWLGVYEASGKTQKCILKAISVSLSSQTLHSQNRSQSRSKGNSYFKIGVLHKKLRAYMVSYPVDLGEKTSLSQIFSPCCLSVL